MNLHDWVDELCDVLDLDTEVDQSLLGDLAQAAVDNVGRQAGAIAVYLLGVAAGAAQAAPDEVERLAGRVQALAEGWDRPAAARLDDEIPDDVPDDSGVDHSADRDEDVYAG